jgi:hypothetical protein
MGFDKIDKFFDAYNTYSQLFKRFFIALCIFALLFFFALFYPYTETLIKKYYVTIEANEVKNATSEIGKIVSTFQNAQNGTHAVETNITKTPQTIQNVSITKNGTKNFGEPIDLSNSIVGNTTANSDNPQIAISGDNVYVVWVERTAGKNEIFFSRSTLSGIVNHTISLSNTTANSDNPQIATSGDNVYVVWNGTDHSNSEIFLRRSTDSGATFSPLLNLSSNRGPSYDQKITASGNSVYVVWRDLTVSKGDIYYRRSTDSGATFEHFRSLSTSNVGLPSKSPQIAVSENIVYVVWSQSTPILGSDIYYRKSTDSGATFSSSPKDLSLNNGYSMDPELALSRKNAYVVWLDTANSITLRDIFFERIGDAGAKSLTNNALSYGQKIAASGNNVYVVWADRTSSNNDVFLSTSTNNGSNFGKAVNLSSNKGNSILPQIALTEDNVYIIWNDDTPGNVINKVQRTSNTTTSSIGRTFDVFFKAAPNSGDAASFSNFRLMDISQRSGNSVFPKIATSGDAVLVVWRDDTLGHTDILLKIDVGRIQDEVQNKYEQYKQVLREKIIEPLSSLRVDLIENTKKILPERIANKIGINNTVTKLDSVLQKAVVLQSQLDNLTKVVKERAANDTLTVQNEPISSLAIGQFGTEISTLAVKDDILKRISDITANTMTINSELGRELKELNETASVYNKDLKALEDDITKISERLDAVQTPLGNLPVGLKESIPIFPILLTSGFLICGYFLLRTSYLRKEFRRELRGCRTDPGDTIAKIVLPLWVDCLESRKKQAMWFVILLIPIFIFGASWIILQHTVNITSTFIGDNAVKESLYNVVYVIMLSLCIIVCCKIYIDTRK